MSKKELKEEQLEKVTGGNYEMQCEGNLGKYSDYKTHVDVDNAVIGEKYLFIKTGISWLYGTLINRYGRNRTLDIKVEDGYGNFNRGFSFNTNEGSSNLLVSDYGTIEINGTQVDILSNK